MIKASLSDYASLLQNKSQTISSLALETSDYGQLFDSLRVKLNDEELVTLEKQLLVSTGSFESLEKEMLNLCSLLQDFLNEYRGAETL